eukprot:7327273-Karenia_brevis.AAC.1
MRSGSVWRQCHQRDAREGLAARHDDFQCGHLNLRGGCAVAACDNYNYNDHRLSPFGGQVGGHIGQNIDHVTQMRKLIENCS